MSEENKAIARRFCDAYNQGTWDQLDSLVTKDYIHHNNDSQFNLEQFKRGAAWFRAGMPDFHIVIEDMVAEGEKVAVRFTGRGTHLGSFYKEAPTGKTIIVYGTTVYHVRDDRICEDWEALDELHFMGQVGAVTQG
jgi:steroid delta-isomerase-like uncharacterized protein